MDTKLEELLVTIKSKINEINKIESGCSVVLLETIKNEWEVIIIETTKGGTSTTKKFDIWGLSQAYECLTRLNILQTDMITQLKRYINQNIINSHLRNNEIKTLIRDYP